MRVEAKSEGKINRHHPTLLVTLWPLKCGRGTDLAEVPRVQTGFATSFDEVLVSDGSFKQL